VWITQPNWGKTARLFFNSLFDYPYIWGHAINSARCRLHPLNVGKTIFYPRVIPNHPVENPLLDSP